jgi:hypothetical protein
MKKLCLLLALGMLICLPGMVMADWSQGFNESGVGNFNAMEAFMVSGTTNFSPPGFSSLSTGWGAVDPNPNYVYALGPATDNMTFSINFTGSSSDTFAFDFFAWGKGILIGSPIDSGEAIWNGSGWTIGGVLDPTGVAYNRVPVPPSVLLLGSGLFGLGLLGRRKIFKA